MNKKTKFIIAIISQIAVILIIVLLKLAVLKNGTDALLKITPVDPRDPLRGDYITFQYNISNIKDRGYFAEQEDGSYAPQDSRFKIGDTVYVALQKVDNYYDAREYEPSLFKEKPTDGSLFIKGVISGGQSAGDNSVLTEKIFPPPNDSGFTISYGIEEYFIPENAGRDVNFFDKEIFAKVAIDKDGNAVLKQVYIDGAPWS